MKRAAAVFGALVIAGALMAPATASTTYEGSVKFGWTITPSFTAHLASNYANGTAPFATGSSTIQQGSGTGEGTCTTTAVGDSVTSYSLSFGALSVGTGTTGCNYKNAIAISVLTNDSNGYTVYESLGVSAVPSTYGVCIFPDSNTPSTTPPNSLNSTGPAAGTFGASLTACAGSGIVLGPAPVAATPASTGGDVGLACSGTTGSCSTGAATSATAIFGTSAIIPASTTTTYYLGEDVQLNIPSSAPSGSFKDAVIVYFIPQ